ncbi:hypothetical protein ACHAXS_010440, partial [Conticribra weissflogii]
ASVARISAATISKHRFAFALPNGKKSPSISWIRIRINGVAVTPAAAAVTSSQSFSSSPRPRHISIPTDANRSYGWARDDTPRNINARTHLIGSCRYSSTWKWSKPSLPTPPPGNNDEKENNLSDEDNRWFPTNSSDSSSLPPTALTPQQQILRECSSLHKSIMPLNSHLKGPLAKNSDSSTSLPFVFLVGNHSSGKSSFINYVLNRRVQTAGVAPTDDCFTVIAPGPRDVDQDGPALVGDPDMGFEGLRQFGPTLVHHAQLKVRSGVRNEGFMMVDSPGMIDSPVSSGGMGMGYGVNVRGTGRGESTAKEIMDRGYDFQGVVRWFAERADVVLLFFDPDKPGTTGETLSILLHSLGGMDHKLLIVLNKADQFKKVSGNKFLQAIDSCHLVFVLILRIRTPTTNTDIPHQIHDFARAYGSLCWNLSKVIPRKDLPRIFTMCLPESDRISTNADKSTTTDEAALDQRALADLHQTRNDVLAEVMKAPQRRIDNVITHLHDSVHLLLMHATVAEDVRSRYSKRAWENRIQEMSSVVAGIGLAALGMHFSVPPQFSGGVLAATIVGVGGLRWFNSSKLKDVEEQLVSVEELSASFQRTHPREVSDADEFYASVWQRVRDPLRMSLCRTGLADFPAVKKSDIQQLQTILDEDIPRLRRLASPSHFGSKK